MRARSDSAPDSLGFLADGGEAGPLMRWMDWSRSPLGHPAGWPQSLRSVVGLMLTSRFPMFVAWGSELGFLYNDAYSEILGSKHPQAMGRPFHEIWSEIWDDISPLIDAALAGRATYHADLPLVMRRKGYDEQTWFTFSYSPVRDETGRVAGMFCACTETTGRVLAARRRDALIELDGRLRDVAETADISFAASELLGEALGASRVGYGAINHDAGTIFVERNWFAPGFDNLAGLHRFSDYGSYIDDLRQGRAVANADVEADPRTAAKADAFRAIGIRAHLDVPVVENGRTVGQLFVHSPVPRVWTDEEISFVRDFAERTHAAIARRVAEQDLRESAAQFRLMADAVPQIVWITDAEGRTEFFNKPWSDYTGVPYEPTTAAQVAAKHIHPDDAAATMVAFDEARRTGKTFLVEHRIRSKAGAYRWFLVRGEPYRDPQTEEVVRWFGASVDIHDRKLAEGQLRELNETLEAQVSARAAERDRLWNLSQDMLARADYGGMMSAVSPAWGQVLGWSETELLTRPYATFMHPEDMPPTLEAIAQMAETRQPARFENRIATRDGGWKHIEWTVTPEPDGVNFVAVGRDLSLNKARETELEQAQEALRQAQKMEAVGQLTGGVAHDFNNLLTIIKSSTDLLRRPGIPEERRRRYVDAISDTVDRASKLTGQLLAFARRQSLKPEVFDAAERLRTVTDMLRTIVGARIQIETDIAGEACFVEADVSQFETALVNMAVNARDAMDGEGRLTVRVEGLPAMPPIRGHGGGRGRFVAVSLADTGHGIPADKLPHIFEPFYTTKEVGKGTGLGLSQVFGFAKQSGGDVAVESEVGRGTTFTLYLPRTEACGVDERRVAQDAAEPSEHGLGRRVLVVEDNVEVGQFSTQILQDLGYETTWAASADEALKLLSEASGFDVVFSDVVMPGMSGVELGREIRRRHPGVPVVLTSGYSHVLAEEGRHGFELLQKPYAAEELSKVLRRVALRSAAGAGAER